ncbi:unnamed protein product [Linum tenue]|uniref:KIB1-4 beta-propeller domain-containing protein n=1 Tax=Linum tenue TaxID=586396 RepID=A0AAV0JL24_9ROSI|nr:unnamed protein product [Linum tenue]
MFCGVGDKEWTTIEGGVSVDGVVAHQGKVYAIGSLPAETFQFFEIKIQPRYNVKLVDKVVVPVSHLRGCVDIRRYLVDSSGELLLFYQSFAGNPWTNGVSNVAVDVKVLRMDFKTMRFEEVEDLGDRTFFLSWSGGFGCCASKSGFKRNTIYMVTPFDSSLYIYDYGDRSVSITLSSSKVESCSMHAIVLHH